MVKILEIITLLFVISACGSCIYFFYKLFSLKRAIRDGSATIFPDIGIEKKEHNTIKNVDGNLFSYARASTIFVNIDQFTNVNTEVKKAFVYGNRSQN